MKEKVLKVMEEIIRPQLAKHYGDISLVDVKDNVVYVKLLGACSGCPSARFTIEDVVLASLQNEIPSIEKVELVQEVSSELLDMAKKILRKGE
ncbi:NifU family protein [Anaeromicrobium sediminis]|uniref:NIF system FeS cluster assembly NifU C-terminal domain-containing protein n=1 Tax=Anaeromicrobium sediminis TaxID=1478221 RepID=A0A267MKW3_9FIRM|nr:NifU family protein [Anaeromicrobium sediminis]PAB59443.1 hypothetical protein CCE28_09500 [Anaeromicrobium sediminis]